MLLKNVVLKLIKNCEFLFFLSLEIYRTSYIANYLIYKKQYLQIFALPFSAVVSEVRKCSMKFDSSKLEVLVQESNKYPNDLHQRNINITKSNLIWSHICAKTNAIRDTMKTLEKVKDLRCSASV